MIKKINDLEIKFDLWSLINDIYNIPNNKSNIKFLLIYHTKHHL